MGHRVLRHTRPRNRVHPTGPICRRAQRSPLIPCLPAWRDARQTAPRNTPPIQPEAATHPINLAAKLSTFATHWTPRIVGRFDGHDLMVVKVPGEFVWHDQPDTDDFFMVLSGALTTDWPDGAVTLHPGEVFVVLKGTQHRPRAGVATHLLLIEPTGTPNTGDPETAALKTLIRAPVGRGSRCRCWRTCNSVRHRQSSHNPIIERGR
jgi:mannose-6-phosphate isomerase-like protein (cupin superfamily)